METEVWKTDIYESHGKSPYEDWLHALKDERGRAKIRVKIDRVRLGNFGDCRSLGEGLFELKIDFGPGYRVYFGQGGKNLAILLCGGDKGTQGRDIEKAREYWADYRKRKNENERLPESTS